jgi:hypothetical protein
MTKTPPAADQTPAPRKAYEPPRLEIYGDIRKITQNVDNSGTPDGGHGAHSRTG